MCQALLGTENIRISKTKTNPCPPKACSLEGRATGINHIIVCVCPECDSGEVLCSWDGREQGFDLVRADFFEEVMRELKSVCRPQQGQEGHASSYSPLLITVAFGFPRPPVSGHKPDIRAYIL